MKREAIKEAIKEAIDLLRDEWASDKSDVICRLIHDCNCPGDENGGFPDQAICFRAAKLIEDLQRENEGEK